MPWILCLLSDPCCQNDSKSYEYYVDRTSSNRYRVSSSPSCFWPFSNLTCTVFWGFQCSLIAGIQCSRCRRIGTRICGVGIGSSRIWADLFLHRCWRSILLLHLFLLVRKSIQVLSWRETHVHRLASSYVLMSIYHYLELKIYPNGPYFSSHSFFILIWSSYYFFLWEVSILEISLLLHNEMFTWQANRGWIYQIYETLESQFFERELVIVHFRPQ